MHLRSLSRSLRKPLRRSLGKSLRKPSHRRRRRPQTGGGWDFFRGMFTRKNRPSVRSNQKSGWFSWFPSFFTKKNSNNGVVFMSGDEQKGQTGAQLEENHRNREQFKKNIKESNNELRGIFGIEERNKENQPISKSKSMNSIRSMKSKSMKSG